MKKVFSYLYTLCLALISVASFGQGIDYKGPDYRFWYSVSVGNPSSTPTPANAYLQVGTTSSTKGMFIPRGDTAAVVAPTKGLLFNKTSNNTIYLHTGNYWKAVGASSSIVTSSPISGLGTVASPLRLASGNTPGQIYQWDGSNWVLATLSSGGITSINGLTASSQTLAIGSSGTSPNIVSSGSTHTINIPAASATATGTVNTSTQTFGGSKIFSKAGFGVASIDATSVGNMPLQAFGGFSVSGTYGGSNPTLPTAVGSKCFFDPSTAAFRAGYTSGTQWSTANNGLLSACFGFDNTASGSQSVVAGGNANIASATQSTVSGGQGNTSSGVYAAVGGGQSNTSSGQASFTAGFSATASGLYATAFTGGTSSGRNAFSNGSGSFASGDYCHAFGRGVVARSWGEFSIGTYNTDYTPASTTANVATDRVFSIGIGNGSGNFANAITVLKSGYVGIGATSPTHQLELSTDDAYKPGTATWGVISDARIKANIQPYEKGLKELSELNPVAFNYRQEYISDGNKPCVGFLAQDVESLQPDWVNHTSATFYPNKIYQDTLINGVLTSVKISDGAPEIIADLKTVNYSELTFLLLNSVKQLAKRVEELEATIQTLKK